MEFTFFTAGRILQHSAAALVLLALVALVDRRRRPGLMAAIDVLAWFVVAAGALVAAAYLWELVGLLSGNDLFSKAAFVNRARGSYAPYYWGEVLSVAVAPQLFWIRRCRTSAWLALLVGAIISAPPILRAAAVPDAAWPPAVRSQPPGLAAEAGIA